MKGYFTLMFFVFTAPVATGQDIVQEYHSTLARESGTGELGIQAYVLVILNTGLTGIQDKELRDSLFAKHFLNIDRLAAGKKLVATGPFYSNDRQDH